MQQPDYITKGMEYAATRHSGAMSESEIEMQYREIQARPVPKAEMVGYVAPDEKAMPDTGALSPATIRRMKVVSWFSGVVSLCAAFIQQAATGAFNQYFGWAIVAAAGVFLVSGVAGAASGSSSSNYSNNSTGGGTGGGWHFGKKEEHHHHYHQYNQQGPNNNQQNNVG